MFSSVSNLVLFSRCLYSILSLKFSNFIRLGVIFLVYYFLSS